MNSKGFLINSILRLNITKLLILEYYQLKNLQF